MKKRVSLKDIAQQVGVSTALVSYVLNNKKTGRIGKEVAQKIKEVARALNYHTNHAARSLKTSKTFTIGLIVADIANTFFSTLARIIEDEAEKNNYTVLFGSSDESDERLEKFVHILLNHQVDGFLIVPSQKSLPQLAYLQEHEIPFVLLDRYFPDFKASHVAIDNYAASYNAVQHLIQAGYQRIGMITYETSLFHLLERKRGYEAALKACKLPRRKRWVKEVSTHNPDADVQVAINQLLSLEEPIDAILFASNTLSTLGLKYLNTMQISIPGSLGIVSFDQSDAADLFYAPLTHIKQPLPEMGRLATQMLIESIEKNNKTMQVNMQAELVVRSSSQKTGKAEK